MDMFSLENKEIEKIEFQDEIINIENSLYVFNIDIKEKVIIQQIKKEDNNFKIIKNEYKNLKTISDILMIMNGRYFEAFKISENSLIIKLKNYENLYFLIKKESLEYYYLLPPM